MALSNMHRKAGIAVDAENGEEHGFYPSQPEQLLALLEVERLAHDIWEPACGDGAISKILEACGHRVFSSDLIDRGYGLAPLDFLLCQEAPMYFKDAPFDIVTNPPYGDLVEPFMRKALQLATGKICFLLRIQCLAGQGREAIYRQYPPARVWVFSNRTQMYRNGEKCDGGGMFDFIWMVWERGHQGKTEIGWMNTKNVLSSQQQLDLGEMGPSKSFATRPCFRGEELMATKETFFEKVVDYAKATAMTVEDAFDELLAHIDAKKAEIDASQKETFVSGPSVDGGETITTGEEQQPVQEPQEEATIAETDLEVAEEPAPVAEPEKEAAEVTEAEPQEEASEEKTEAQA